MREPRLGNKRKLKQINYTSIKVNGDKPGYVKTLRVHHKKTVCVVFQINQYLRQHNLEQRSLTAQE